MALEDKRIEADTPLDERIAEAITSRLDYGRLSCAAACELAAELDVPPIAIGRTADRMHVRLTACQLGFFGSAQYAKGSEATVLSAPDGLVDALLAARNGYGEISCARLWYEAQRFSEPRIQAGCLADRLGIKVRDCSFGTF